MKRTRAFLVLLVIASLVLSACSGLRGSSSQTFELKVGYQTAKDYQDEYGNYFVKEVEKLTKGAVKGTAYNAAQLGNPQQQNQAVRAGTQEGIIQPTGIATSYLPELGVLDLPFMFTSDKQQTDALNGAGGDLLRQAAEKQGIVILAFVPGGAKDFVTTFPFKSMADLKGKKLRVIESPELVAQVKSWGAVGIPLPFPEVYTALQQGTIDGLDNAPDTLYASKFYEPAKNYTISGHGHWTSIIAVSKKWFDTLPADLQKNVRQAAVNTAIEAMKIRPKWVEDARKGVEKGGATVSKLPDAELAKMREASKVVWDQVRNDPKKGPILAAIEKAMK